MKNDRSAQRPLVSAIVSTYNAAEFLSGCLFDLSLQTVLDRMEVIVVNSGSQQNEAAVVRSYAKKFRNLVYIRTERRETLYKAWNRGIRAASGKYIVNANTDDRSAPEAFQVQSEILERRPDIALVYSDLYLTRKKNEFFGPKRPHWSLCRVADYSRRALLRSAICGPRPMYRKNLHRDVGWYNDKYVSAGDCEFWLRLSERYVMLRIPRPLTLFYTNPAGLSQSSPEATAEWNEARIRYLRKEFMQK